MILVPYFLVGAFLVKMAIERSSKALLFVGACAALYGIWLLYASGIMNLLLSVVLYAPGLLVFLYARSQQQSEQKKSLLTAEKIALYLLLAGSLPALWYLIN